MRKAKRNKEMKSLELFKKGFRKNEIVIYAIALMLVTAGYFNYTANLDLSSVETYSEEFENTENKNEIKGDEGSQNENIAVSKSIEEGKNEIDTEKDDNESIGDAKLVNSNSVVKEENGVETNSKMEEDNEIKDGADSADYFHIIPFLYNI